MKPLHNVRLAITGRASSSRTPFIQLAEDNGASVAIDLDLDCSHLVVLSLVPPNQSDPDVFEFEKVQAARKAQNPIKVVWQEWLEDSAQRGGCLPETPYLVQEGIPRPGRLHLAGHESPNDQDRRTANRTHPNDEFEPAVPRKSFKFGSQNAIMASMIAQQDLPIRRHHSDLSTKPLHPPKLNDQSDVELPVNLSKQLESSGSSILHSALKEKNTGPASIVQKLRSVKSTKFGSPSVSPSPSTTSLRTVPDLFQGLRISTVGCLASHQRTLAETVTRCGGQFTELHSQADYTIVPLINPPFIPRNCNPVGHHWVEQSLFARKIMHPDDHWSGRPIRLQPLPNPDQYIFSSCGYNQVEEHILQQALKVMNLKYIEHPRRSVVTHFFIGPDKSSARLQTVKQWTEKELVDFEWLVHKCNGQRILRSDPSLSQASASRPITKPNSFQSPAITSLDLHPTPLSDCVILMTRKGSLHPSSKHLTDCRKLGARVVDKLMDSVTHVIHAADRPGDSLRELKAVRARNIYIVHPNWLSECSSKLIKADELTFPSTYKPERALSYCASPSTEVTMADVSINSMPEEHSAMVDQLPQAPGELVLENDETFYETSPSRQIGPLSDILHAQTHDFTARAPVSDLNSLEPNDGREKTIDSQDRPTSSHDALSPPSNAFCSSSPSHCSGPGVDTQLGGFMEILQQRNQAIDFPAKTKEKDRRRARKRLIDDSVRPSAINNADGSHPLIPIGHVLDRAYSDFSPSSATASHISGFMEPENSEESIGVTWEDPAAKRKILKAINDQMAKSSKTLNTLKGKLDPRHDPDRQLTSDGLGLDFPVNDAHSHSNLGQPKVNQVDAQPKSNHNGNTRPEHFDRDENHCGHDDTSDNQEIVIVQPSKRRRRLIRK